MITFKTFFESKKPLGSIETISIEGIGPIEAKVDSGNGAYNVLHGYNIIENGNKMVSDLVSVEIPNWFCNTEEMVLKWFRNRFESF